MDISATDRNPEPGDDPLLFSTVSKGSFRCTQPQTVMHTTKPLLNQLGTTGICPHRSNQPTQDSNPGPSDHESQTLCVSPPGEDRIVLWYGYILWISGLFVVWGMCSDREMSPIEHVWDKLGRAVRIDRKRLTLHSTLLNLRQLLLEEWVRIPQRYIQTRINSMRYRFTGDARGGVTRYWSD